MLARDRAEWGALCAALDAQPSGAVHDPESPAWEAKDVYNHFTRWINHSTDDLEARLVGRDLPRPEGPDDEINVRWQAADARLTLAEARDRAQQAFERRFAAIQAVPRERWDAVLREIAHADGYPHIEGHREYIEGAES